MQYHCPQEGMHRDQLSPRITLDKQGRKGIIQPKSNQCGLPLFEIGMMNKHFLPYLYFSPVFDTIKQGECI
jgi:hypothetical protein